MKQLSRDDLIDILHGSAFMGTGGGGEIELGMRYIDAALDAGKTFRLVSATDLDDATMTCTPYALGATRASELLEEHARLPKATEAPIVTAINRLASHVGAEFGATVACELGGENTAVAAYAAAMIDGALLDADAAGRAVPEITHSTYCLAGLSASPVVMANEFGETMLCENIFDDQRAEDIARSFAMVSRDDIVAVDHAATIAELEHALYHGSISMAAELGAAIRSARTANENAASQLAAIGRGKILFQGTISNCEDCIDNGFTCGFMELKGSGDYTQDECRIEFKNENMMASINSQIVATIPDLICVLNDDAGEALTNPNGEVGMNISVVVLPAPPHFTTAAGLEIFGPAYIGLSQAYTPAV